MKMGRNMKIEIQIIINLFFSSVLLKQYDILLDITYIHISYILAKLIALISSADLMFLRG